MALDTASRFADPDAAYRLIVEAHRGLDDAASRKLDAALILILSNQIGDLGLLREAITLARQATDRPDIRSAKMQRRRSIKDAKNE